MDRSWRILCMDDDPYWIKILEHSLLKSGYELDSVSNVKQAKELLAKRLYHLVILDIQMVKSEEGNDDGLKLLAELSEAGLTTNAFHVLMLTAKPTTERMRTSFAKYGVIDFLEKKGFKTTYFLERVKEIFADHAFINLELTIRWQNIEGPEELAVDLEVDGVRAKRSSALQKQLGVEIEDLLCRLFHEANSILVRPLTPGHSGAKVLSVQPQYVAGGGQPVIVKFGDFSKISKEHQNYQRYVAPFIGGGRRTNVEKVRYTSHLGGIIYSFLGVSGERLEDFGNYYDTVDISQIRDFLDNLFLETCNTWYANLRLITHDLSEDYRSLLRFTPEKLEQARTEKLKSVQGKEDLTFISLDSQRKFINPIWAIGNRQLWHQTYVSITHGDFSEHNIFHDSNGQAWLIDFLHTEPDHHILRDIARLDSVVRFNLLGSEDASLEERLRMEEVLCSADNFNQLHHLEVKFPTDNLAVAKAYATALHLRRLGGKVVERNTNGMNEYYIALLFYAMNTIRYYSLSKTQREHALLSASLLAERLEL